MDNKFRLTTEAGKTVWIRTRVVGGNFGVVGEVLARNGRVIASTPNTYPYGFYQPAMDAAKRIAESL